MVVAAAEVRAMEEVVGTSAVLVDKVDVVNIMVALEAAVVV